MPYWQHHRTDAHHGTEDCSTVVLTTDIGRYASGTPVCEVLADMDQRLAFLQTDYLHGFSVFTLDAYIAPYDPGTLTGPLGVFSLDAYISNITTFSLDAFIGSPPFIGTVTGSFGLSAYIFEFEEVEC